MATPASSSAYRENGARKRLSFGTVDDAIRAAKVATGKIASGNAPCVGLMRGDGFAYRNAVEALKPFRIPVDLAAKEYAEGLALPAGRASILEAVRHFARTCPVVNEERTVADVVEELVTTRERDGSSPRHVDDLVSRLRRFATSMACPIASVTPARIHDFLLSLGLAPRTANNLRQSELERLDWDYSRCSPGLGVLRHISERPPKPNGGTGNDWQRAATRVHQEGSESNDSATEERVVERWHSRS